MVLPSQWTYSRRDEIVGATNKAIPAMASLFLDHILGGASLANIDAARGAGMFAAGGAV
jgi:hypothetical protein